MNLWIRSQDKKDLIKAEYISTSDSGYCILVNGFNFGFYETAKRALEVLDEIQKEIFVGLLKVYQMPEE